MWTCYVCREYWGKKWREREESGLTSFFLAWLGDPDLTREKSWVRSLNYKAQLEVSVVYLSGYDQQAAAPANLKSRPSVIA